MLTDTEWLELLEESGFSIKQTIEAPMLLLNPHRMIHDEGPLGALKFVARVVTRPVARRRILALRRAFGKYSRYIKAVSLVVEKPA